MEGYLSWSIFFIICIPFLLFLVAIRESLRQLYNKEQLQNVGKSK